MDKKLSAKGKYLMNKERELKLIAALDIGTSKIVSVVAEILPDDSLSIIGLGSSLAKGMEKGGVKDLDLVIKSIKLAINEASLMAGCNINSLFISISGRHIACQNENGMVSIAKDEVSADDIDNVVFTAKSVPISAQRKILHVLPQEFAIDCQEGIKSPVGMSGMRLEAKVHIITCANDMAKNITKCVKRSGLKTDKLIFSALASSYAVLTEDEKELGVCLVDIGGGTMDLCVYINGSICHTAVIPIAGNQVTSDIAKIFRTPIAHAEAIKIQYACALRQMVNTEESMEVPSVGGRPSRNMSRHILAEVVEPRYQELFELIKEEITKAKLAEKIAVGIVLTGGAAKMEGVIEYAEDFFQMPVRIGTPNKVKGLSEYVDDPSYASAVGLLHYGHTEQVERQKANEKKKGISKTFFKIKNWFKGEF